MEGRVVIPHSIVKSVAKVMVEMLSRGKNEPIPGHLDLAEFSFGGWDNKIILTGAEDAVAIEVKPKDI